MCGRPPHVQPGLEAVPANGRRVKVEDMSKAKLKKAAPSNGIATNTAGTDTTTARAASDVARPKASRQAPAPTEAKLKPTPKPVTGPVSKLEKVIALLKGKNGATIEQLGKVTGWQPHSIRGAMSGAIKKRLGLNVTSELRDGCRIYRIGR